MATDSDKAQLTEGDEYSVRRKPAREYEARLILAEVSEGEFLSLWPNGEVILEYVWAEDLTIVVREKDADTRCIVAKGLIDFDVIPSGS